MKLTYRGVTYDRHPSQADNRSFQQVREPGAAYNLSYRGVTYRLDPNAQPVESARPVTYQAIYRGITYFVRKTARGEVTFLAQVEKSPTQAPSRSLLNRLFRV
ncbi:MAG: hypothetical protein N4J56_001837 [Chroococcidiopsis sp. SAG 2025]|uniref:DUF4278 domain-containing protein n=1 Tax=Chroococcidiopsis sp. SAG 2025 TaxID=171389 RepID=UPI0029373652|nr:DUF4278 domain-containing protein [Chroococcidiopsis sp. SAG 2025]MDV2992183.1 hypothetical protein [Chroococcidiopsis sp. SAG 2025]